MSGIDKNLLGQYLAGFQPQVPVKPKVFVSYHHKGDQPYYDLFVKQFADGYEILTDTSVERKIDSDSVDYQQQVIREQHITGSSITIVLCGRETWKRRWVDWEIHMTLNKEHALLGIALPNAFKDLQSRVRVPNRLHVNIVSGYAHFIDWTDSPALLRAAIDTAREKARVIRNINNSEPRMQRNQP